MTSNTQDILLSLEVFGWDHTGSWDVNIGRAPEHLRVQPFDPQMRLEMTHHLSSRACFRPRVFASQTKVLSMH